MTGTLDEHAKRECWNRFLQEARGDDVQCGKTSETR